MQNIPLVNLKSQYQSIKKEINEAINNILDTTAFIDGPIVDEFEKDFARYCNCKYAISMNSGTAALHISMLALGFKAGDEVITTPHTFIATSEAISQSGAKIVFADIDPKTYNIDPKKVEKAITSRTKAILPVHIYGQPSDMTSIQSIAKKHNLAVIEDCCQAHGAKIQDQTVPICDIGAFSFYPGKNLGAYGDGGILVTNSEEIAKKCSMLRDHGRLTKYEHEMEGYNQRLDTIQAAILSIKLKQLNKWTDMRIKNAGLYTEKLKGLDIITPYVSENYKHVYHLYVIQVHKRDQLLKFLNDNKIGAGIHYPIPLHLQPAYKHMSLGRGSFPVTEKLADSIISLPMYPEITEEEIDYIVMKINEFYKA